MIEKYVILSSKYKDFPNEVDEMVKAYKAVGIKAIVRYDEEVKREGLPDFPDKSRCQQQ